MDGLVWFLFRLGKPNLAPNNAFIAQRSSLVAFLISRRGLVLKLDLLSRKRQSLNRSSARLLSRRGTNTDHSGSLPGTNSPIDMCFDASQWRCPIGPKLAHRYPPAALRKIESDEVALSAFSLDRTKRNHEKFI